MFFPCRHALKQEHQENLQITFKSQLLLNKNFVKKNKNKKKIAQHYKKHVRILQFEGKKK